MIYVLEIAYKGTAYHGWQIQKNAHTIQAELNKAIETLIREPVETLASGRTDTGVHAEQQFVQFSTEKLNDPHKFIFSLNAILPRDIFAKSLHAAPESFSVRFDGKLRSYEYRISQNRNPFLDKICHFYFHELDIPAMNEAAKSLLTHTDFKSFSKVHTDVDHFECTISEANWEQKGELLIFYISANRFLRGMVRAIVGTLLEIGLGKITANDFDNIILEKNRKSAKHAVPPEGLFLTQVAYEAGILQKLA